VFNAITKRPVHTASWGDWTPESAGHVTLAHDADALAVVPATAHTIARLALGLADDLLGTIALSTRAPAPPRPGHGAQHVAPSRDPGPPRNPAVARSARGGTLLPDVSPRA
jgi:phosphopantothenoylcysteine decarboxylase/phosphopantothenate--cysteine ligase